MGSRILSTRLEALAVSAINGAWATRLKKSPVRFALRIPVTVFTKPLSPVYDGAPLVKVAPGTCADGRRSAAAAVVPQQVPPVTVPVSAQPS